MAELVIKLVNGELAGKTVQSLNKELAAANLAYKKAAVGTQEWIDAAKKVDEVKDLQGDLKKQIESTTAASDFLKKSWNSLPGAQFFNGIGQSFGNMKKGVGGLVSQFGVLKTAIAATGLGLLVVVIASLVSWLTKTDEGATFLDGIFRAIGNTVDVLLNRLINLKDTLTQLFTNPGKFFRGLITDIKEGIEEGRALADTFDELDQKRRDMELADQNQVNQIDLLLSKAKDIQRSLQERLEILDQVDDIERRNHNNKLTYHRELVNAIDIETARMIKNGTITDEQLDKQNNARIELLRVDNESIKIQERIQERRNGLLQKEEAERKRLADLEKKRQDELRKAEEQRLKELGDAQKNFEDQKIKLIEDGQAREIAAIELNLAREVEAILASGNLIAERTAAAQELAERAKQEIKDKYAKQAADKAAKEEADRAKKAKEALDKDLELVQQHFEQRNLELLEQLADGEINRKQFDDLAQENIRQSNEEKLRVLEEHGQAESELYRQIQAQQLQDQIAAEERKRAAQKQGQEATFNALLTLGNATIESQLSALNRENAIAEERLAKIKERHGEESAAYQTALAKTESLRKANFEKSKKLEKQKIKINMLSEVAAIIKSAVEIGGIYGIIVGAVLSAASVVRATKAMKEVDAQKYSDGGLVKGPSHSQGGIPGVIKGSGRPIEFEGGEFFFSAKATRKIGAQNLARVNDHFTRKLALGGLADPFGGSSPGSSASGSGPDMAAIMEAQDRRIEALIAAQDRRIDRLQVINNVGETEEEMDRLKKVRNAADV